MTTVYKTYRKIRKLFLVALLTLLITPSIITSQAYTSQHIELPEVALEHFRIGMRSDIYGIRMSLIYFAGKYKIQETSKYLVEELTVLDDGELCSLLVWSLYQIGNESCFKELQEIVKNHDSEELKAFCSYLSKIKEFEIAIAKNDDS